MQCWVIVCQNPVIGSSNLSYNDIFQRLLPVVDGRLQPMISHAAE
jgi:hypothetical protein